jgi:hypothetical protein
LENKPINQQLNSSFAVCFQTAGADILTDLSAVLEKCRPLDIRLELALGMLH